MLVPWTCPQSFVLTDKSLLCHVISSIVFGCCIWIWSWESPPPIFAGFATYSRQNSNQTLEMTSGFQPDSQTAVFKQFALQGVCVSSEKTSWTCFCLWQLVGLLVWIFPCKHSTASFLAGSFRDAQTDSVWLSTHNCQHLFKMSTRNARALDPLVTVAFTWYHTVSLKPARCENYCPRPECPCCDTAKHCSNIREHSCRQTKLLPASKETLSLSDIQACALQKLLANGRSSEPSNSCGGRVWRREAKMEYLCAHATIKLAAFSPNFKKR